MKTLSISQQYFFLLFIWTEILINMGYSFEEEVRCTFHQWNEKQEENQYLENVAASVSKFCGKSINIKIMDIGDFKFTIGGQDNTIYKGDTDQKEDWENAYLPDSVKLEVLGVVAAENNPTMCVQLVLLLCEDRQVYAYDGEEMHLVARSPDDILDSGLQYPGIQTFSYGQRFENMTMEEWNELKPEHKTKDEEHLSLIKSMEPEFLKSIEKLILFDETQDQYLKRSSDSTKTESNMDGNTSTDLKQKNTTSQPVRKPNGQKKRKLTVSASRSGTRSKIFRHRPLTTKSPKIILKPKIGDKRLSNTEVPSLKCQKAF